MTNARKAHAPKTNTGPTYEDMLEAFVDACCSAGLSPVDGLDAIPAWIADYGWDAVRHNGDSFTLARMVADDERIDLAFTDKVGIVNAEHSFRFSRLDLRLFELVASCMP